MLKAGKPPDKSGLVRGSGGMCGAAMPMEGGRSMRLQIARNWGEVAVVSRWASQQDGACGGLAKMGVVMVERLVVIVWRVRHVMPSR